MEVLSNLIKVSFPKYLRSLPIPSTLGGFAKLSGGDWFTLLPFVGAVSFVVYATVKALLPAPSPKPIVNQSVKKDNPKVVDLLDIEDVDKAKLSYCRCWRSSKFPLCDGAHNKHNEETGDNVGPLVVKTGKGE